MLALFGYMDLMIIMKWLTNWEGRTANAPSIISTMIDMFLNFGQPTLPTDDPLFSSWAVQTAVERYLMLIVAIAVPLMLFVKPIALSMMAPKKPKVVAAVASAVVATDDDGYQNMNKASSIDAPPTTPGATDEIDTKTKTPAPVAVVAAVVDDDKTDVGHLFDITENIVKSAGDVSHQEHDFGELMIHQLIETIEFVLGTVSNTASYLRLWALSLAHSELARVFFDNCLNAGFQSGSVISMFIGFFVFCGATFGVLMCMDLLECTLHTLRLHWVEFQNKFFKG